MLRLSYLLSVGFSFFAAWPGQTAVAECRFKVLVYDTLVAKDGLFPVIKDAFKKKENCELVPIVVGDGGQLVARIQSKRTDADGVIGLDQSNLPLVRDQLVGKGALAFDHSPLVWLANKTELEKRKLPVPSSVADLLSMAFEKQLLLQDPRGSAPGLIHLLFMIHNGADLKKLRKNVLALAPDWGASYSLFRRNQAPLVWTYLSSLAYHLESDDPKGEKYFVVDLKEGAPVQTEFAALLQDHPKGRAFLALMVSENIQSEIPKRNWMFPIYGKTRLPESFKSLKWPKLLDRLDGKDLKTIDVIQALKTWEAAIQ